MAFNQYSANHKTWDHVGNLTPNVEYCEAARPHGEFIPAAWLPVGRYDKFYEHYFVVSAGKVVAFDREGRIVPAGLKVAFAVGSSDVLTYVATTDNAEGVIDLTTGATVSASGAGYTRAELGAALIARGLLDNGENAEDFISFPIGVAPYNFIKWAGGDGFNPAEYIEHNYNMQHRVGILCNYVIEVPLVPALQSACTPSSGTGISNSAIADWSPGSNGAWFSATSLSLTARYAADVAIGDDVVLFNMPHQSIAKSTTLTPFTLPSVGMTDEKSSMAELSNSGDYFVDYEVGAILFFKTGGTAIATITGNLRYYAYDTAPASVSTFACALGELWPGDFVRPDANSNFVKASVLPEATFHDASVTEGASFDHSDMSEMAVIILRAQREIVGQVLDREDHPKDYLDRVRTAYATLSTTDQMPGSASGGFRDQLTYAGASNRTVRILLLK